MSPTDDPKVSASSNFQPASDFAQASITTAKGRDAADAYGWLQVRPHRVQFAENAVRRRKNRHTRIFLFLRDERPASVRSLEVEGYGV